jgi:hypothetical protein
VPADVESVGEPTIICAGERGAIWPLIAGTRRGARKAVARLRHRPKADDRAAQPAPEVARFQAAMEMHELGVRLYRQRMHREHPRASRSDIERMVKAWLAEPQRSPQLRLPLTERGRGVR